MSKTPYRDAMQEGAFGELYGQTARAGTTLTRFCHELSKEGGWWPEADLTEDGNIPRRVTAEKLLLIHT